MSSATLRRSALCLCFLVLSMTACSKGPSAPTGLAVGIGAGSEAIFVNEPYSANPIEAFPGKSGTAPGIHGTFSVENFHGTHPNLSYAHDSANGFREFLTNWYPHNFVYRDDQVGAWAFHDLSGSDNWDLWNFDGVDRGIDAVMVVFNSSHGVHSDDGVFTFALGENWSGRGWNARSDSMTIGGNDGDFGDERNRYIFWDTSQSVRWSEEHNPYDTWGRAANGVRMIFGYDDDTVDSPDYGTFFWEEWNKGKSLSTAFLDASWRIDNDQSPCVVAFGATSEEATEIRNNETMMSWTPAEAVAGAWRWYYTAKSTSLEKSGALSDVDLPNRVAPRSLHHRGNSSQEVYDIALSVGIRIADDRMIQDRPYGLRAAVTDDSTLIVEPDGDFELRITRQAAAKSTTEISDDEALVDRARQIIDQFGLAGDSDYDFNDIRYLAENQADQSAGPGDTMIVERTVVFDQVIDGLPFIDPDAGHLEITFAAGNDEIVGIRSTMRAVIPAYEKSVSETSTRHLDDLRRIALHSLSASPVPNPNGAPKSVERLEIVNHSESIGYQMIDGRAVPVYRALLSSQTQAAGKLSEAVIPLAEAE